MCLWKPRTDISIKLTLGNVRYTSSGTPHEHTSKKCQLQKLWSSVESSLIRYW